MNVYIVEVFMSHSGFKVALQLDVDWRGFHYLYVVFSSLLLE